MPTTTEFEVRQNYPMVLSGIATIDNGQTASLPIYNGGRAVVRLGFPTMTGTTMTFTVQPFPPADPASKTLDPPFRPLYDVTGANLVSVTVTDNSVVTIPELSGCYAFTIVSGSAEGSAREVEVQCVGPYPTASAVTDVAISGTVTVSGTVTANLGTPVTATTATETGVAANAGSVTVLASNALRKGALITNSPGSADLYLRFSATAASIASGGYSVVLTAGQTYEMGPNIYSGQINGIWSAATGFANVSEF